MLEVGGYTFDLEAVERWAREKGARRLLLQAPDGLKAAAVELARRLEQEGFEVLISGGHAWGGCDVAYSEAGSVGAEGILHLGHHGFVGHSGGKVPVLFLPALSTADPAPVFGRALEEVLAEGHSEVALGATVQHVHHVNRLEEVARGAGVRLHVGELGGFRGLVVGCNYSSLSGGSAVVVVAGGVFHGLGAALWTGKPTWVADPYLREVKRVDVRRFLAVRLEMLSRAMEARRFAVLVSVKPGQRRLQVAELVAKALRRSGREALLVVLDEVTREALENLTGFEAFVNTACPRLAVDDAEIFPAPVVNVGELKYVLKGSPDGYSPRDVFLFDPRGLGA